MQAIVLCTPLVLDIQKAFERHAARNKGSHLHADNTIARFQRPCRMQRLCQPFGTTTLY